MFKRVWGFALAMPFFMLAMPYITRPETKIAVVHASPATTVRFASSPDAPDPNAILALANQERQAQGLSTLIPNKALGELAAARAADMASRQYYAHRDPDGKYYYDYLEAYGVLSSYSCENLDLVFSSEVELPINDWLNSNRGHRQCLLTSGPAATGYATKKFTLLQQGGVETTAYIIVAINAQLR